MAALRRGINDKEDDQSVETISKDHVTNQSTWVRLLYLILFVVIFNVAELVILAVVIFQFLTKLFTGHVNAELRPLSESLAMYAREVIEYLTQYSDDKPYPFGAWPKASDDGKAPAAAKKPARKRKEATGGGSGPTPAAPGIEAKRAGDDAP